MFTFPALIWHSHSLEKLWFNLVSEKAFVLTSHRKRAKTPTPIALLEHWLSAVLRSSRESDTSYSITRVCTAGSDIVSAGHFFSPLSGGRQTGGQNAEDKLSRCRGVQQAIMTGADRHNQPSPSLSAEPQSIVIHSAYELQPSEVFYAII